MLLTIRRHPKGPERSIRNYRMAPGHVRAAIEEFFPRSPDFRRVLDAPEDLFDWTRGSNFRESAIAKEHLLIAGFTQGVSFALMHAERVVGTFNLNFTGKAVFSDLELQALDAARYALQREVAAFVIAGDVGLTRREMDVLRQMATGASNAEISAALRVSRNTVTTHVERVLHKLKASNRLQAVHKAVSLALV
jgi:DNA-binding CsgD family transcriptional regulator